MVSGMTTDGWKENVEHWILGAKELCDSMYKNGFLPQHAIPIDEDGELLNGAHRVACAIAYSLPAIYTWQVDKKAWAPAWDYKWFKDNGCPSKDLKRIDSDWRRYRGETSVESDS